MTDFQVEPSKVIQNLLAKLSQKERDIAVAEVIISDLSESKQEAIQAAHDAEAEAEIMKEKLEQATEELKLARDRIADLEAGEQLKGA